MLKIIKLSLLVIGVFLLSGCATTANYQRIVSNWQGRKMSDLISAWGYPDASIKLPGGDTVYMYVHQQNYITPSTPMMTPTIINVNGTPMSAVSYNGMFLGGQTMSLSCRTWFEVDPRGNIVNVSFQGNNCIANNPNGLRPN